MLTRAPESTVFGLKSTENAPKSLKKSPAGYSGRKGRGSESRRQISIKPLQNISLYSIIKLANHLNCKQGEKTMTTKIQQKYPQAKIILNKQFMMSA